MDDELGTPAKRQITETTNDELDVPDRAERQVTGASTATVWTCFSTDQPCPEPVSPLKGMPKLRVWDDVPTPAALKDYYNVKEHLGKGSFASVLVGQDRETKNKYAIKILPRAKITEHGLVDIDLEMSIAGQLQHPYIVYLYRTFADEENLYLVMELCKGGDLFHRVVNWTHDPDEARVRDGLPVDMVGRYLWQMLMGIAYLHHHNIVHRDVKCENYMLKSRLDSSPLKLLDFGFACKVESGTTLTQKIGTPYYMAPEILDGAYNEMCDMYSVGVCCFFMCIASYPYNGNDNKEILARACEGNLEWDSKRWSDLPYELSELVPKLLSLSPGARPSARDIINVESSWLRTVGWNDTDADMLPDNDPAPKCCMIS